MRKRLFVNGILALVVVAAAVGTYFTVHSTKSSASTTQIYATATRANVLSSVTSTGNVEAPTDLSLSFQQSGQVTSVLVSVGQHVVANQALATVDDTADRMSLASAQAGLVSAQASLAGLIRGETPIEREQDAMGAVSASQGITQAQQGVTDAQQLAASDSTKFQASVAQAQQALTSAQANVTSAQTGVGQAESALSTLQSTADPGHPIGASTDALTTRYEIVQVHCGTTSGQSQSLDATPAATITSYDGVTCAQASNLLNFVKSVQSAQSSVSQAQSAVTQAQAALTSAEQEQSSGEMQDQQSIQKAQDQLTTAQTQYQTTLVGNAVKEEPPKPEQLAEAQASIVAAQAQFQTAQKNESETTLRAPVAGVVAAVNGLVGQQSGSGGGSSSSSSSGGSSASSGASSGASSSSASSSSGSAFIELTDVNLLEVKVGFTETDAPNVHVGQAATITLDALPNQTFTGHVIELDTDSTLVSNVVTYYAVISFDTRPTGVKPGMTASVNVVLQNVNDAITLPTSAVSTTGTTETVTVKAKDGTVSSKLITIGLRGDNAVQIISGLNVGDQVVETSTASTGSSSILGRFGGGGLGGGLGGGGGGFGGGGGGRGGG